MTIFGLNLLLAAAWMAMTGAMSLAALAQGFVLGLAVIWLMGSFLGGGADYLRRLRAWGRLGPLFLWELALSSLQVARDLLRRQTKASPAILAMPLDVRSDAGIFLVTSLITLTPGTLSLDVTPDRRRLLIHAMFADDPEALIDSLKRGIEAWVIAAVEPQEDRA